MMKLMQIKAKDIFLGEEEEEVTTTIDLEKVVYYIVDEKGQGKALYIHFDGNNQLYCDNQESIEKFENAIWGVGICL